VPLVFDLLARKHLESLEQSHRFAASVRLGDADDDIAAGLPQALRLGEHRVRLADAGRCAEEYLQPAACRARLFLDARQEVVGVGSAIVARVNHPM
jgi:hypothetical protein